MLNKYYVVKAILLCNGVLTFLDRGSTSFMQKMFPIIMYQTYVTKGLDNRAGHLTSILLGMEVVIGLCHRTRIHLVSCL